MKYINPPSKAPANIFHRTFYSRSFGHELGYNIYLPEGYEAGGDYPVHYHLHGWTNDESTDIWTMKDICRSRQAITVFPNNSPVIEDREDLPVEEMIIHELIPHIDSTYRTSTLREHRSISGFSMGGGMAFYLLSCCKMSRTVLFGNGLRRYIPPLLPQGLCHRGHRSTKGARDLSRHDPRK